MDKETMEYRFNEAKQKTFLHGGLMVIDDKPPHEWLFDEDAILKFIRSEISKHNDELRERVEKLSYREDFDDVIRTEWVNKGEVLSLLSSR